MTDATDENRDSSRRGPSRVDDAFHVFDTTLRDGAQRQFDMPVVGLGDERDDGRA